MKRILLGAVLFASLVAVAVMACNPQLTSAFLLRSREILQAPEHWLGFQIHGIRHEPIPPGPLISAAKAQKQWRKPLPSTLDVDVEELHQVLTEAKVPLSEVDGIISVYKDLRFAQLARWEDAERRNLPGGQVVKEWTLVSSAPLHHPWITQGQWPQPVPQEFRLYAEGVMHLHQQDMEKARNAWNAVLALPVAERRHRSVWAAWMLYKTATMEADVIHWLDRVCEVVQREGCVDSLRMHPAALSLLAELKKDPASLATLSTHYYNAKANERSIYCEALKQTARHIAASPDQSLAVQAAADPAAREIITLVLAHDTDDFSADPEGPAPSTENQIGGVSVLASWAAALKQAGVTDDPVLGDFAIALYRQQKYALARQFITSGGVTWGTLWIRAKLDLQRGDKDSACRHMAEALRRFPAAEKQHVISQTETVYDRWNNGEPLGEVYLRGLRNSRFLADSATMRLGIGDFSTSLKLFLDADCPHDAAYVAEHLMTSAELVAFIREHRMKCLPSQAPRKPGRSGDQPVASDLLADHQAAVEALLYVAARKLAREHWFKDARPLMPEALQPLFDRYVTLYHNGHNSVLRPDIRARSLMEAARIHRWMGMELFGAEGEPDGTVWKGEFGSDNLAGLRDLMHRNLEAGEVVQKDEKGLEVSILKETPPSVPYPLMPIDEETSRLHGNMLWGKPRFHYRYEAAELAWQAAHLLPTESEEAAGMLGEAGSWIADRSPKEADRFYKEMIWKHWSTPIAREADKRRWFPGSLAKRYNVAELLERPVPGR